MPNPVTESKLHQEFDLKAVQEKARAAFNSWSTQNLESRLRALDRIGDSLRSAREQLVETLHRETGKPLDWSTAEVDFCLGSFAAHREEFKTAFTPEILADGNVSSEIRFRPLGVVLVFSPFNSPLECLQLGLLPALAAGNTVIVKSSELAPKIVERFISAFQTEIGEAVQVVHGGGEAGAALVRGSIDMVVFTGSEATGRRIAEQAGRDLKRVILELGGKDPLIVLKDADLASAAEAAITGAFGFAGQVCTASEQVWVEKPLFEPFLNAVVARARELGNDPSCPRLISKSAAARVLELIDDAVAGGACLVTGGARRPGDDLVITPAVLTRLTPTMRVSHEEIFGPAMCLHEFASDAELVSKLSESQYALGATIHARDLNRARRLAELLPNAVVGINRGCIGVQGTPWLGARASGLGLLGSIDGHRQFTSRQVITV